MKRLSIRIVSLLLILSFFADTYCHGLATLPASRNPSAQREILAALERTQIRYAESADAKRLLRINNAECLLLSSGGYLVTREVAKDDTRLLRAIFHEDIEAMMQIIAVKESARYRKIKRLVLEYFPPQHGSDLPVDLHVNHTVARAFEWLLLSRAVNGAAKVPRRDKGFVDEAGPLIEGEWSDCFREDFWDTAARSKKIRESVGEGMRFYQTFSEAQEEAVPGNEDHAYISPAGTKYYALHYIRKDAAEDDEIATSYSFLKLGRHDEIRRFSDELVRAVKSTIGAELASDSNWIVVSSGRARIPNASYLIASDVADQLNLPHVSVALPIPGRRSPNNRIGISFRGQKPLLTLNHRNGRDLEDSLSLKGKKVIFVDDSVLSGTVLDTVTGYISRFGPEDIRPYIVARLEGYGDAGFEEQVDTKVLREKGTGVLVGILNEDRSEYTTRMVYHLFNAGRHEFTDVVKMINSTARFNLYLYALEYFGPNVPDNINILAKMLRRDLHMRFPGAAPLRKIDSDIFMSHIEEILNRYGGTVPTEVADIVFRNICDWLKPYTSDRGIKLALFDLDQTLSFSRDYYDAVKEAGNNFVAERLKMPLASVEERIFKLRQRLSERNLTMRQHDIIEEFGFTFAEYDEEVSRRVDARKYVSPDPAAIEMLRDLKKRNVKLGIVTDSAYLQCRNLLKAMGIYELFDGIFTPETTGYRKPDTMLYEAAVRHFGLEPRQAVMVGNSRTFDLAPAKALGMRIVLIRFRENLPQIPALLFRKTDIELRLENFISDYNGFKKRFFGDENNSRGRDNNALVDSYLDIFRTFWSDVWLTEEEMLYVFSRLLDHTHSNTELPEAEYYDNSAERYDYLNDLIGYANRLIGCVRKLKSCQNRVYIGMDGLLWSAADRGSSLFFMDGFTTASREELEEMKPFLNHLLPEHQTIVHEVMQLIIDRAIDESNTSEEFEKNLLKRFQEELTQKKTQRLLAARLNRHAGALSDGGAEKYAAEERKKFLLAQVRLLEERNIFAEKAAQIAQDFRNRISSGLSPDQQITLIDKAVSGIQPWFVKCAVTSTDAQDGGRIKLRLFVGKSGQRYKNKDFGFLVREDTGGLIESVRPVKKRRGDRVDPMKPVFQLNTPRQQLDGMLLSIMLARERESVVVGIDKNAPPISLLVDDICRTITSALEKQKETFITQAGSSAAFGPEAMRTDIKITNNGSTARNTYVLEKGIDALDYDYWVLFPGGEYKDIFEAFASYLWEHPETMQSVFREKGYELTPLFITDYEKKLPGRYKNYKRITYSVKTKRHLFKIEVNVQIWGRELYSDLFSMQMKQISSVAGYAAMRSVTRDIRRLKSLLMENGLYRRPVSGVSAEQLIIQSGREGADPLKIHEAGSLQKAFTWILSAAGYPKDPDEAVPWDQGARQRFKVYRSYGETAIVRDTDNADKPTFFDKLDNDTWKKLVAIARKEVDKERSGRKKDRPKGLKVILFDLNGTLYVSPDLYEAVNRSWVQMLARRRHVSLAKAKEMFLKKQKEIGFSSYEKAWESWGYEKVDIQGMFMRQYNVSDYIKPSPAFIDFMKDLSGKYRLFIESDSSEGWINKVLESIGIKQYFEGVINANSVGYHKEDPAFFRAILHKLDGIEADEILSVGNTPELEVVLARAAGMHGVPVNGPRDILTRLPTAIKEIEEKFAGVKEPLSLETEDYIRHRVPDQMFRDYRDNAASIELHYGSFAKTQAYLEKLKASGADIQEVKNMSRVTKVFRVLAKERLTYIITRSIFGFSRLDSFMSVLELGGIKKSDINVRHFGEYSNDLYDALLGDLVDGLSGAIITFESDVMTRELIRRIGEDNIAKSWDIRHDLLKGSVLQLKNGAKIGVFYLDTLYGTQAGAFTQWLCRAVAMKGQPLKWIFVNGLCGGLGDGMKINDIVLFEGLSNIYGERSGLVNSIDRAYVEHAINDGRKVHIGDLVTTTDLFSETRNRIEDWKRSGIAAVDMELSFMGAAMKGYPLTELYALLEISDLPGKKSECLAAELPSGYSNDHKKRNRDLVINYILEKKLLDGPEEAERSGTRQFEDVKLMEFLTLDIINAQLRSDKVYTVKYDVSRLSGPQTEMIGAYVRSLRAKSPHPENIRQCPFSGGGKTKRPLISVFCEGDNFKGEGHVDVSVPEGEPAEYSLRIMGMMNIALASSNIPGNMSKDDVYKYRPILSYINNQYRYIAGMGLAMPDSPEDILKVFRNIVLVLPKSMRMNPSEIEQRNRLTKEAVFAA